MLRRFGPIRCSIEFPLDDAEIFAQFDKFSDRVGRRRRTNPH